MSKKDVVFIPSMQKFEGNGRYLHYEYGVKSWQKWCEKNDVICIVWDESLYTWDEMTFPWQRYHLFQILEHNGIEYDQILMVDADTVIHPDTPYFFNDTERKYVGVVDQGCWNWSGRSIALYKNTFDGFELNRGRYINGGFQIVNEVHKDFFNSMLTLYKENINLFIELQKNHLGTDQTPLNYMLQKTGMDVKIFDPTYNLHHMVSKNLLPFGTQWPHPDSMQLLYDQAWIYHFNSIPENPNKRYAGYFIKRAYTELYETRI